MRLYSVVKVANDEPVALVPGYYHSEFQKDSIAFTIEFDHRGAGEFCEYSWANYPKIESLVIWCDRELILNGETLPKGSPINDLFDIEKFETESFSLAILLRQSSTVNVELAKGYYTFEVYMETEDNESHQDSAILKLD